MVKLHAMDISPEEEQKNDNPDTPSKDYASIRKLVKSNTHKSVQQL